MTVTYKYISADNHLDIVWLPRNLWQDRVEAKYRERAPNVVETDKGTFWEWEGKAQIVSGAVLATAAADGGDNARYLKQFRDRGVDVPDGALPPSNPAIHLQHMDMAGIYANVLFGNTRKWRVDDPDLLRLVYP